MGLWPSSAMMLALQLLEPNWLRMGKSMTATMIAICFALHAHVHRMSVLFLHLQGMGHYRYVHHWYFWILRFIINSLNNTGMAAQSHSTSAGTAARGHSGYATAARHRGIEDLSAPGSLRRCAGVATQIGARIEELPTTEPAAALPAVPDHGASPESPKTRPPSA